MKDFSSLVHLEQCLVESLEDGGLITITQGRNIINGVGAFHPNHNNKTLFINILITDGSKGIIKQMMEYYDKVFPGYTLEAMRFGKLTTYNKRFTELLHNL